jgi:hypothetical protein
MPQRYSAYLLRHWQLANGRERVEVQHIQTGDRTRHPTLADACAWLTSQAREPTPSTPAHKAHTPPQPGGTDNADSAASAQDGAESRHD